MENPAIKRYKEEYQQELDRIQESLIENADIPLGTKKLLRKIKGHVCDVRRGMSYFKKKNKWYTIPVWAHRRRNGYFTYYIAHELSHLSNRYRRGDTNHSKDYYENFIRICPKELQHFECNFKPRMTKMFGIEKKN